MEANDVIRWLLAFALKGSAILAGAMLIAAVMRNAASATRHLVLASALLCILLLPALSGLVPVWQMNILPEIAAFETEAPPTIADEPVSGFSESESASGSNDDLNGTRERSGPREVESASRASEPETSAKQEVTSIGGESPPVGKLSLDVRVLDQGNRSDWWPILLLAWPSVGILVFAWLLLGIASMRGIVRNSQVVSDPSMSAVLLRAVERLGVTCSVDLLISDRIEYPLVWGFRKPVIILPREAAGWSEARLQMVLLHELAHIRRADNVVRMIASIALSVFWFNPLAWLAARWLHCEQEQACDDLVLNEGVRPSDYAAQLLQIAAGARVPALFPASSMARKSTLKGRIMSILDPKRNRKNAGRIATVLVLLAAAALVVPLASAQIWGGNAPADQEKPEKPEKPERPERAESATSRAEYPEIPEHPEAPEPEISIDVYPETPEHPEAPEPAEPFYQEGKSSYSAVELEKIEAVLLSDDLEKIDLDELRAQLKSGSTKDRAYAAFLIAQLRGNAKAAIPELIELLADGTEIYVKFEYRGSNGHTIYNGDTTPGYMAAWALGAIGKTAYEPVVAALNRGDVTMRGNAVRALRGIGDKRALEHIIPLANDKDRKVRYETVRALREFEDPKSIDALAVLVRDEDEEIRIQAVRALRELGGVRTLPALRLALGDSSTEVRIQAVRALREMGHDDAVRALIPVLGDGDNEVRIQAVRALRENMIPEAIEALKTVLDDDDREVKLNAVRALREYSRNGTAEAIAPLLKDGDVEVRLEAIRALREKNDSSTLPYIVGALSDPNKEVKDQALRALRESNDKRAVPAVIGLLEDEDESIRDLAVRTLRESNDDRAVAGIVAAWPDPSPSIRELMIRTLREYDDPAAFDVLVTALDDDDKDVRTLAIQALRELGDPRAANHMLRLINEDPDRGVRSLAARAYAELEGR